MVSILPSLPLRTSSQAWRKRASELAAGLQDDVVAPSRLHHLAAFGDEEAERLLAVDVLAGLAGVDGDQGVPVIGDGDDDGVDIAIVEDAAIVGVGGAFLAGRVLDLLLGGVEASAIDIADGDGVADVGAEVAAALVGEAGALVADADVGNANAFVGALAPQRLLLLGGELEGRDGQSGEGGAAEAQEIATGRHACSSE